SRRFTVEMATRSVDGCARVALLGRGESGRRCVSVPTAGHREPAGSGYASARRRRTLGRGLPLRPPRSLAGAPAFSGALGLPHHGDERRVSPGDRAAFRPLTSNAKRLRSHQSVHLDDESPARPNRRRNGQSGPFIAVNHEQLATRTVLPSKANIAA